jgi:phytoene dehydrogenase-like protein
MSRSEEHRAIVVGAGIGGTAAALLLQEAGIKTTLVEKNRAVGGSCASYEKRGFKIDIGTHMFSRGPIGPLGEVLRRVERPGEIRFVRTRDIAELRTREGGKLLSIPVPADMKRIPRFLVQIARALKLSPLEAARTARMFAHILSMSDEELESWYHRTVEEYLRPYTENIPVMGLFGYLLGLYFILPYWEVSAGEAFWSFRRMVLDNWLSYPIGGADTIPTTYARIAKEKGAEIRTGTGVRRIVVQGGRVRGVELSDGTLLPATIVVSTSSVRTTVLRLVGEAHFPEAYVERARTIRGSYIATQAKIALDKKLVSAGAIVGGVGEDVGLLDLSHGDLKAMFDSVIEGRVPPVVPFYCPVPTNFDPSLAPPGSQLLTVCAVAPTSDIVLSDPALVWEEAMLRAIRRVIPRLDEHVLFIDRFNVRFIENWIGKEFGPAVSTAQTPDQVGKRRPTVYTPVRGLYLAGCGAGGRGVGTELAAQSAMECVDRILADVGQRLVLTEPVPPKVRMTRSVARLATIPLAWATRA